MILLLALEMGHEQVIGIGILVASGYIALCGLVAWWKCR